MELLLIIVLGGLCFWLMKPLRDWYVVEFSTASGRGGQQYAFKDSGTAELEFDHLRQELRNSGQCGQVFLWKVEARSRRHATKLESDKEEQAKPVLLKFEEIV